MPILIEGALEQAVVVPLDEPEVAADVIVALDSRHGSTPSSRSTTGACWSAAAAANGCAFPAARPTRWRQPVRQGLDTAGAGAAEVPQPRFVPHGTIAVCTPTSCARGSRRTSGATT